MIHEAIYKLYPNESIKEIDNVFTAYDKDGNKVSINMSEVNTKVTELQMKQIQTHKLKLI